MSEPTSMEEYTERFMANSRVEGFGFDVTQALACPFCAAPEFMELKPIELAQVDELTREHTCDECGRTLRMDFKRDESGSTISMAQTGGDDPPAWLQPPPPDARGL